MNKGIQLLVEKYREEFRIGNEGYYSKEDYQKAKRRYMKFRLNGYSSEVRNSSNPNEYKQ